MQVEIDRGKEYLFGEYINADSARACFERVAKSYRDNMPQKNKELCATAANNLGFTYFYYLGDYRHAYEWLVRSYDICCETGKVLTTVNVTLNLGNVYTVFAEHVDSPQPEAEGREMYIKAFEIARKNGLWHQMLTAFANLTSIGNDFSHLKSYDHIIYEFGSTAIPASTPNYKFTQLRYKALRALQSGDFNLATIYLKTHIDTIDADMTVEAYRCQALTLTSAVYSMRNMPDSALYYARRLLDYSAVSGVSDSRTNAWRLMENIYRQKGDNVNAREAHLNFLEAQDSLFNHKNLAAIGNLKFIRELSAEKEKSARLSREAMSARRVNNVYLVLGALLLLCVCGLSLYLYRRHRLYRALYEKYRATLRREDEEKEMRDVKSFVIPHGSGEGSMKIISVIDNSPEIYSADFSLHRLAELAGLKSRVVSAILNDSLNTSFRDLLNTYRVREASRRLSDFEHYGHLTIEAISSSVGYKSRTSLISAFKRETGLTPSEFQKQARKTSVK